MEENLQADLREFMNARGYTDYICVAFIDNKTLQLAELHHAETCIRSLRAMQDLTIDLVNHLTNLEINDGVVPNVN